MFSGGMKTCAGEQGQILLLMDLCSCGVTGDAGKFQLFLYI